MDETIMITRHAPPNGAPNRVVPGGVRQLASDVVTLVELQAELFHVDLRQWLRGCILPVVLLMAAAALLFAGIPVLLLSLAYVLSDATELSMAACLLISAGAGIAVAGVCIALAIWGLKRDARILKRFSAELRKNIRWLKQVLTHPSTAAGPE